MIGRGSRGSGARIEYACVALVAVGLLTLTAPAAATPVCTDGYKGGPPAAECGGRIFPEAHMAQGYVQYLPNPAGFAEYQHGIEYLAQKYPRWISVFSMKSRYGDDDAVSAGPDRARPYEPADTGDGRDIWVIKITDHEVPDAGKSTMLFSLAVHGNERGGLEGGLRTAEDLAMAANSGGVIRDGLPNYQSTTGRAPVFHEYQVRDVLAKQAVYLVDFNIDGWAVGDFWNRPPVPYTRGNSIGTDLNRQMPTVGRINPSRNPLQESEMLYGHRLMHEVAAQGRGSLMDHAADVHGELTSQAYVDIMYPAGQFDSVDHRRLMAIAERVKSVIDATLYQGIVDQIENASGGNEGEAEQAVIPTKPAHWATVWDTLGYTDTGFIGDYMATDLAVTGMDYEIFLNHTVPDKNWNVYLQENHINGTRAMIKTSMAYALFQEEEFNERNFVLETGGRPGYVVNPDTVTDRDENGPGTLPGPNKDGIGADTKRVEQRPYEATNMRWFRDTSRLMSKPFVELTSHDVGRDAASLDAVDTLVLADVAVPADPRARPVDPDAYIRNIRAWVERGGNLVLTDRALHVLGALRVVDPAAIKDIKVYQPYANISDFSHHMVKGLRRNARQLVEAAILGYGIGNSASPMTIVTKDAWEKAGGKVVATTGAGSGGTDDGSQISIGELKLGNGLIRIVGGALPTPTEENDHRYGLRDYAMTYTGLYIMENSIQHDVPGLGVGTPGGLRGLAIAPERLRGKRLLLSRRSLKVRRGKIRVRGRCRSIDRCRGTVRLVTRYRPRRGARTRTVLLARSRFSIAGKRRGVITFKVSRRAQRFVRRRGRLRVLAIANLDPVPPATRRRTETTGFRLVSRRPGR